MKTKVAVGDRKKTHLSLFSFSFSLPTEKKYFSAINSFKLE